MSIKDLNKKYKTVLDVNEDKKAHSLFKDYLSKKTLDEAAPVKREASEEEVKAYEEDIKSKLTDEELDGMDVVIIDDDSNKVSEDLDDDSWSDDTKDDSEFDEAKLRDIPYVLNGELKTALAQHNGYLNNQDSEFPIILFTGRGGFGKTAQVNQWAKTKGINLVSIPGGTWSIDDIEGMVARDTIDPNKFKKLKSGIFDPLMKPNSVLFIDEYTTISPHVRAKLFEIINSHKVKVRDPESGEEIENLPNWLFTILTRNPSSHLYNFGGSSNSDLMSQEATRIGEITPYGAGDTLSEDEQKFFLDHIINSWDKSLKQAREMKDEEGIKQCVGNLNILQLFRDNAKTFKFDSKDEEEKNFIEETGNKHAFCPRSLSKLLLSNRSGSIAEFIARWDSYCNALRKNTVKTLLDSAKDKINKANKALLTFGEYKLKLDKGEIEEPEDVGKKKSGAASKTDASATPGKPMSLSSLKSKLGI